MNAIQFKFVLARQDQAWHGKDRLGKKRQGEGCGVTHAANNNDNNYAQAFNIYSFSCLCMARRGSAWHRTDGKGKARWAVFYDTLSIKWEYEKEGYDLPSGRYLPDFWLPKYKCWVEIKGAYPKPAEETKMQELTKQTKKPGYIFWGAMPFCGSDGINGPDEHGNQYFKRSLNDQGERESSFIYYDGEWSDNNQRWCRCEICGKIGIAFDGRAARLCKCHNKTEGPISDHNYNDADPILLNAYAAAINAKFKRAGK